jgi:curli production assembly/transport component CsgE
MLATLCVCAGAFAQTPDGAALDESGTLRESYGGIVLNQTITVGGQEFYRQFTALWRDKPLAERYAISIHERPSARWGSQVWVEFAQRRMFQSALPSARSAIGALSERAAETAYQNVVDTDVQRLLFRNDDLGRDEI